MKERPILFSGAMVRAILAGQKTQTRRVMKVQPLSVELDEGCRLVSDGHVEYPVRWFHFDHKTNGAIEFARPWVRQKATKAQKEKAAASLASRHYRDGGPRWSASEVAGLNPYGLPGDHLWVRETFSAVFYEGNWYDLTPAERKTAHILDLQHRASFYDNYSDDSQERWVPSIFMLRSLSRITLEITAVRVERLQDITEADAEAEGMATWAQAHCSRSPEDELYARAYFELAWNAINGAKYPWESNPWVWCLAFRLV